MDFSSFQSKNRFDFSTTKREFLIDNDLNLDAINSSVTLKKRTVGDRCAFHALLSIRTHDGTIGFAGCDNLTSYANKLKAIKHHIQNHLDEIQQCLDFMAENKIS